MKTYVTKVEGLERSWFVVDATDMVLGRLATEVARILRGKHKPIFAPYLDCGDHVIVVNAARVRLTANKSDKKVYYRHSGYPGGLRIRGFDEVMMSRPERVIEAAIRGMLPKNRLGRQMYRKLKVYVGPDHPHIAQRPQPLVFGANADSSAQA
ncbi:MAG: 50S ribosomal protein L13 [Ferrimicrobium sp.]